VDHQKACAVLRSHMQCDNNDYTPAEYVEAMQVAIKALGGAEPEVRKRSVSEMKNDKTRDAVLDAIRWRMPASEARLKIERWIADAFSREPAELRAELAKLRNKAWWKTYRAALTGFCAHSATVDTRHDWSRAAATAAHGPLDGSP